MLPIATVSDFPPLQMFSMWRYNLNWLQRHHLLQDTQILKFLCQKEDEVWTCGSSEYKHQYPFYMYIIRKEEACRTDSSSPRAQSKESIKNSIHPYRELEAFSSG